TANLDAADGGERIVEGNQKVLAARLSDARFFYETDLKTKLEDLIPRLEKIVFHARLGSVADKGARMAGISTYLASQLGFDPALAFRAAHLSKVDLVTGMVTEFPELQGIMGRYYALATEAPEVADALRDHYRPANQDDRAPEGLSAIVALADRLDSLVGFFMIDETPTGSRDPYALRRAALGCISIVLSNKIRLNFMEFAIVQVAMLHINSAFRRLTDRDPALERIWEAFKEPSRPKVDYDKFIRKFDQTLTSIGYPGAFGASDGLEAAIEELRSLATRLPNAIVELARFIIDRLKVQQREAGVRHDLIDAVFALGGEDDLVRLLARVHALQAFMATEDGANLLAGYKRAANILKKEGYVAPAQAG
ncbi:MAG: glycine--tRNA ligase subunit beta, partial [Sphingomonas sp.]